MDHGLRLGPSMPDAPEGGHGMLHADDTLVLAGGRRWYEILNQMLGLSVSPAKSEAMWFGRRYRGALPPGMSVNINGEEVPGRCQMNYLGLIIDSQWTFRPHFEILVPRVTAAANTFFFFFFLRWEGKMLLRMPSDPHHWVMWESVGCRCHTH